MESPEIKLSIIISTFNRAIQLEQILEDLTEQLNKMDSDDAKNIEIILVDNNSTDKTKEVAYKFSESTLVSLKYYLEEKQGLSHARNFGVKQAKGDLVAFLDDDLTLDDDWVKESYKLAQNCKDYEIGVYGGRTIPLWQERSPKWLSLEGKYSIDQRVFSSHSYGDEQKYYPFEDEAKKKRERKTVKFPTGTNVLIRKEIFENCGDLRTDLGTNASGGVGLHEDEEFFDYLSALNIPMIYNPLVTAFHPISEEKMSKFYIRRWYFKSGRSSYWIHHTDRMRRKAGKFFGIAKKYQAFFPAFTSSTKILGAPIYLYIKAAYFFCAWLLSHLDIDSKKRFWHGIMFSQAWGELAGARLVERFAQNKKFSFKEKLEAKKLVDLIPKKEEATPQSA